MLRALWRLVVYLDLQRLLRPCEGRESEVWDSLVRHGPRCVLWRPHPEWPPDYLGLDWCHMEKLDTIADFLSDIQGATLQSTTQVVHLENLPHVETKYLTISKLIPSINTMTEKWN